jgi:hypothetical protein
MNKDQAKKDYEKPRVIYAEKVEPRAVGCAVSTVETCSDGPLAC